ncbi:MAG: hypothetical protein Q9P90_12045 [candidate division KSB1 bacterium]|nr:hypothetical protein [candidate division KSB1 bacterium]
MLIQLQSPLHHRALILWVVVGFFILTSISSVMAEIIRANPNNYLSLLRGGLSPGDTLLLEPGVYDDPNDVPGLPIFNMHGEPGRPVVITGPETGDLPIFLGRATHNTVRFDNARYIVIRNIEINGRDRGGDGVKAQGTAHHITLENLKIYGVGSDQQIVGISTKAPAWNWVIRRCVIIEAGTGIYLGNSDGTAPFVNGLIEYNVIMNTIGYNMQIKHQIGRPSIEGMPEKGTTIIRHNVFIKGDNSSIGGSARPNLLVGHWPLSGAGSNDVYQIYGNFFYQNPGEALFQGEGNIAFHHNLMVNHFGDAVHIQRHNDVPKNIHIFFNTVIAKGEGIFVRGADANYQQKVEGNLVFADQPLGGGDQRNNFTAAYGEAPNYLNNPFGGLDNLDLFPKAKANLSGPTVDAAVFSRFIDWDRDFNGEKHSASIRGAYAGKSQNPGWKSQAGIKTLRTLDMEPPSAIQDLKLTREGDSWYLSWTASADDGDAGGPAYRYDIRYSGSEPGQSNAEWFSLASPLSFVNAPALPGQKENLLLTGLSNPSNLFFMMRVADDAGNWSDFSNVAGASVVGFESMEFSASVEGNRVLLKWLIGQPGRIQLLRLQRRAPHGEWTTLTAFSYSKERRSWIYQQYEDHVQEVGSYFYRLLFVLKTGEIGTFPEIAVNIQVPQSHLLQQNFPNPFNPSTRIAFSVAAKNQQIAVPVRLFIRDVRGRLLRTLIDRALPPGYYEVTWDGKDFRGADVAAGVYFSVLQIGKLKFSKKMVLER